MATRQAHASDDTAQRKEAILTQDSPSKLGNTAAATILKHADLYLLTDQSGDVPWGLPHAFGLYAHDCRFLNALILTVNGAPLEPLSSSHVGDERSIHHLTNPDLDATDDAGAVAAHTMSVWRSREIRGGAVHETIRLRNHSLDTMRLVVELRARCDFEDIFVIKGFIRADRGELSGPLVVEGHQLLWQYHGRDARLRETHLAFDPAPDEIAAGTARFRIALSPHDAVSLIVTITPCLQRASRSATVPSRTGASSRRVRRADSLWLRSNVEVSSSHEIFNKVMQRALMDLRVLRSRLGRYHYFAAGVPWFVTLFGRDSATVALQTLPYGCGMARETLLLLAAYQSDSFDDYRDAQPGKILHELRRGELARLGEIPQSPAYYGTVDATMLFLILAAEYFAWTADLPTIRRLEPNIRAALAWMRDSGDHDGDGYYDYVGRYPNGLINQAWKDSGNAIVNADGSFADPPVATAEVQSYAYCAWRRSAELVRVLGADGEASDLVRRAEAMQTRFERDFWSDELGCYVLARHAGGAAAVIASNAGQVLWGGIAEPARAKQVGARLLKDDMFTGWGVRTLSSAERRFNPISYHLGSVWPHDNSLILSGLRRYGLDEHALRIFNGVFDAAVHLRGFRLPELFGGYRRRKGEPPVPYPYASAPQAWAAGALPYSLWSLLGLHPDAEHRCLRIVRPVMPHSIEWLELDSLRVGDTAVRLRFERQAGGEVAVDARVGEGDLRVEVI